MSATAKAKNELRVCETCVETHFGATDPDVGDLDREEAWRAMETRLRGIVAPVIFDGEPVCTRTRANLTCACCSEPTRMHFACTVEAAKPAKPGKASKASKGGKPSKPAKPGNGERQPWSERGYRVLSNPLATPKMHETLESAVAHGKRHMSEGRSPLVQAKVNGEWVEIDGWAAMKVSPRLPYRW